MQRLTFIRAYTSSNSHLNIFIHLLGGILIHTCSDSIKAVYMEWKRVIDVTAESNIWRELHVFSSMEIIIIFSLGSCSPERQLYGWFIKIYIFIGDVFIFLCVSDIVATLKRSKIQMKKKCSFRTGEVRWPK